MIRIENDRYLIETSHTGYYLNSHDGLLENLHYGRKIHCDRTALSEKIGAGYGTDVVYFNERETSSVGNNAQTSHKTSLLHLCLELSPTGKGDFRRNALELELENGSRVCDFKLISSRLKRGNLAPQGMPGAHGGEQTLELTFLSPEHVVVLLYYTTYPDCDVITRRIAVKNETGGTITLCRCLSYQLDLPQTGFRLSTFTGAWAREQKKTTRTLTQGICAFGSTTGVSSHYCTPFFMVEAEESSENMGEVYGFNLIYSGSHFGQTETGPYSKTRIMAGIQPDGFSWSLQPGERFDAPEGVLTFSNQGRNGMSQNMHRFVQNHIVRGSWAKKERPILFNNWEATYFNFNETKLLRLAKEAKKLGIELFVLDDGWFGNRTDDTRGLGDYDVNRKKLPGGLRGLADKINQLGLDFGLWMEPEMVNPDSKLFIQHPDWAVGVTEKNAVEILCRAGSTGAGKRSTGCAENASGRNADLAGDAAKRSTGMTGVSMPSYCRNQLVLDLCKREVQDYLIQQVNQTLDSANIRYVKWDMNRPLTDEFSMAIQEQGRFFHAWTLGLYRILEQVTSAHPEVLFEGCASGGNRFDLGILCYMPQIWTSDDTDCYERMRIQTGTSYGYPQSVMACHVSASPNHQTLRTSPLESRFDVASFGLLGYELDLTQCSAAEKRVISAQIKYYKEHRHLFQYGKFFRIRSPFEEGEQCCWMVVSQDQKEALVLDGIGRLEPNSETRPLRLTGLLEEAEYQISSRSQLLDIRTAGSLVNQVLPIKVNSAGLLVHAAADHYMLPCETEVYKAYGDLLMYAGLKQKPHFIGTGYDENVRLMPDYSARIYYVTMEIFIAQSYKLP